MAKEKREKKAPILDDSVISELLTNEVKHLPRNLLKEKIHAVEDAKNMGMTYKEIAVFFTEKLNIPVKASHVKEVYEAAHPEKVEKKSAQNHPQNPQQNDPQKPVKIS